MEGIDATDGVQGRLTRALGGFQEAEDPARLKGSSINALWSSLIVEELWRNGIHYMCISPGSRSTPLAVAAAHHGKLVKKVCCDERSAAFHGLGFARATGRPAAVVCTSGTAVANYLPAVIEANNDMIPLLLLTADRPPELRSTGANQTIEQPGIMGRNVRWHFDLPCPDERIKPEVVLTTICQAVYRTFRTPSGPVHLNCMFREPLVPAPGQIGEDYLAHISRWRTSEEPYTCYALSYALPNADAVGKIAKAIQRARRGLVVVGRLSSSAEKEAVQRFVEGLGWPVFADVTSELRLTKRTQKLIAYFDQLLLGQVCAPPYGPDTILHIGGRITSSRFLQYLETNVDTMYLVVKNCPLRHDPCHRVILHLECDVVGGCREIADALGGYHSQGDGPSRWAECLMKQDAIVDAVLENELGGEPRVTEPGIARAISKLVPAGNGLFLANSMPIRDMDMYGHPGKATIHVDANRGASGIDGIIATAAGFAQGLGRPVTLLIGDTSFLHDLNSLALVASSAVPLVIVVINNNGGGIFSMLPISSYEDVFEKYFSAPHNLSFGHAASLFGLTYCCPGSMEEFIRAYENATTGQRNCIIEVMTDGKSNAILHERIRARVRAALEESGPMQ